MIRICQSLYTEHSIDGNMKYYSKCHHRRPRHYFRRYRHHMKYYSKCHHRRPRHYFRRYRHHHYHHRRRRCHRRCRRRCHLRCRCHRRCRRRCQHHCRRRCRRGGKWFRKKSDILNGKNILIPISLLKVQVAGYSWNTEDHHHKDNPNDVTPGILRIIITRTTPTT